MKIGSGNRGDLADCDKNVPGVGRYDISKKMKGSYYSINGKGNINDIKDNGLPGPNKYLPNLNDLWKAPVYSFTHAEEPDEKMLNILGSGAYSLEKDNDKPKYGFGIAVRDKETKNEVPGPWSISL